ncbi:dienelactone hydrolase [Aquitalea magnusonii]|uniref:Dienelactone hydrolase n=3 Tax=Aquitalea magnusonii TaxID=332411 RepID=A0A318JM49_9NEIS|nr:dienelactone hydrolase [Aquitalea magnusonii]
MGMVWSAWQDGPVSNRGVFNKKLQRAWHRVFLALLLIVAAMTVQAETLAETQPGNARPLAWQIDPVSTGRQSEAGEVKLNLAIHLPADGKIRHIVLYPSPNGQPAIKSTAGGPHIDLNGPWIRTSAVLEQKGIAVAFADPPDDAAGHMPENRPPLSLRRDLQAVLDYLTTRYPGVPVSLGLFAGEAVPVLDVVSRLEGVHGVIVASGGFLKARTKDWHGIKTPVLLIHAPGAQCDAAPYPEAEYLARLNGFALVQARYPHREWKPGCGKDSQHVLAALDEEFAALVARWLDGAAVAAFIGHGDMLPAWHEEIVHYAVPAVLGHVELEMTLLFPDGTGPFPLLVFNHGDMELDSPHVRDKQRFRDMIVAREFLYHGIAVAFPSRQGVGLSEGGLQNHFSINDAAPLYKAKAQSADIVPAIDYLKTRKEIDPGRIILSGQSAGGYCAMYLAGINLPGVIGVVNFSGGRTTNKTASGGPEYRNQMMIDGFAEVGKTAQVPALLVFTENDSRYSANTIQSSQDAFVSAGGKSTLLLLPPIAGDGHFVFHQPQLWRAALSKYLGDIGIRPLSQQERGVQADP